jgi:hypothetical protein
VGVGLQGAMYKGRYPRLDYVGPKLTGQKSLGETP